MRADTPTVTRSGRRIAGVPALLAGLAAAFALLPIVYLAVVVAGDPAGAVRPLVRGRVWTLLVSSVALAAAVTATSVVVAVALAWLIERTDIPGRRVWRVAAILPLALPSYVAAYLLVSALGPRGELVQALEPLLGIERLPSIYGFPAAWLTLSLVSYPYVLIPVAAALRGQDPALEEAARSLGHGAGSVLLRVTLPQLRPAIGGGALLVALYVLSDFGAVALSRYDTFTRAIFTSYKSSFDRSGAAGLAVVLVVLTIGLVVLERRTRAAGGSARAARSAGRTAAPRRLGRWRLPALAVVVATLGLTVLLPLSMLGLWLVRAAAPGIDLAAHAEAGANSMLAALLAAGAASLIVLPVTLSTVRARGWGARLTEAATYAGHALPGIVVALALAFLTLRIVPGIYQTLLVLVLALALLYLPQALAPQRASLLQVSPRIVESARSLGARPVAALLRVQVPLMRRGLLAGGLLVFLTAVKELPATLMLAPPDYPTLATRIWTATSTSAYEDAAVPSLLLLLAGTIPLLVGAARQEAR